MTRRRAPRTLAILLLLAAVLTAGAPAIIRVKPGDSLWDLARAHHTTVAVLRNLNDLPGNGTIYAGQLLKVPGSTPRAAAGPRYKTIERSYTVRSGDNLTLIASRHHVSVRTLIVRNKLPRNGLVTIGRKLAIPTRVAVGSTRTTRRSSPAYNAGVRIPDRVRNSVGAHRAYLATHRQPSKATVRK